MTTAKTIACKCKWGAPAFCNSLPFFYPLQKQEEEILFDNPRKVNFLFKKGELDCALVSSIFYLQNGKKRTPISNFGIGATKKIESVCLFTKVPIKELSGKTILLPSGSETSIALLYVLAHVFWKVTPKFVFHCTDLPDAFLYFGDECLTKNLPGYEVIDLASSWHEHTQKSFIFALFHAREGFEESEYLSLQLENALKFSKKHEKELVSYAQKRLQLPEERIRGYFHTIDFKLTQDHFDGLHHFYSLFQSIENRYVQDVPPFHI